MDEKIADAKSVYESDAETTETLNAAADELLALLSGCKKEVLSNELISDFAWNTDVAEANEKTKQQNSVYGDLYLPSNYLANGRTLDITWESDKADIIDSMGYLKRPLTNAYVNLKAVFTDGTDNDIRAEKTFKTRVLAGGDVILNVDLDGKDLTTNNTFAPKKNKFMISVSGDAGEYIFTFGGAEVKYNFAENGDYDIIYNVADGSYEVWQNCEKVGSGSAETENITAVNVSGSNMTKIIGIDLDTDKAKVNSVKYSSGEYELGIPTPGGEITGVDITARESFEKAKVYVAVYAQGGGLLGSASKTVENVSAGESLPIEFEKTVKLPEGSDFNGAVIKVMLWNDSMNPLMESACYNASELYDNRTVLYMIGDSTMCNYTDYYYPQTGWGQVFSNYLNESSVKVDNRAVSGRTTKWFAEKGEFDKILSSIKPGDYLFMQFGHNDQKPANNISVDLYKKYLGEFVDEAKAKGAVPVICTSISRRTYNSNGEYDESVSSLGEYPQAAASVAAEKDVLCLDLYAYSKEVLGSLDSESSKQLYCWVPNSYEGYDASKLVKYINGAEDNTHFSEYGANIWAKQAAKLLKAANVSVSSYVINAD